jgi:hypothetical protein
LRIRNVYPGLLGIFFRIQWPAGRLNIIAEIEVAMPQTRAEEWLASPYGEMKPFTACTDTE